MKRTYTRAGFVAAALVGGAAVYDVMRRRTPSIGHPRTPRPTATRAATDFAKAPQAEGWGPLWQPVLYDRTLRIDGGAARYVIPPGNHRSAPDQPMPIMLLDHAHADGEQHLVFAVDNITMRPGLLVRAGAPYRYAGVTIEGDRLVAADYDHGERTERASQHTQALGSGELHHIRLRSEGSHLYARAWRDGDAEPDWQLDAVVAPTGAGTAGVLVVHPTNFHAGTLSVTRHELLTNERLAPTAPTCPVAISGIPQRGAGGGHTVRLRVWCAVPSRVVFEWAHDVAFSRSVQSAPVTCEGPPYAASHEVTVPGGKPLHWRAHLTSLSSKATGVTEANVVPAPDSGSAIALLAASCYKLFGPPANQGFPRLLEASPAARTLVFEGDMGYANNFTDTTYAILPDFFFDRFQRFMADPGFEEARSRVPCGFIMDDHDYGPSNNADRTTVKPWTIELWNRLHADPTPTGYFDFRVEDVHCLTLDGRRYCDPVKTPNGPSKTKLGRAQRAWLERTLRESDAAMFVIHSADTFAARENPRNGQLVNDCFIYGWPDEYRWALGLFMEMQLRGQRVIVLSGDAHSLRIHHHADPLDRPAASAMRITEFICSGIRAELWSGPVPSDPSLDHTRSILGVSGAGLAEIDPPGTADRGVTLRAIDARAGHPLDVWPPLRLPFSPA